MDSKQKEPRKPRLIDVVQWDKAAIMFVLLLAILAIGYLYKRNQKPPPPLQDQVEAAPPIRVPQVGPQALVNLDFPQARLPTQIPFPPIKEWNTLHISLQRNACFSNCPTYRVDIYGDGRVRYEGCENVARSGIYETRIPVQLVRALFEEFRRADFFSLFDEYPPDFTDAPSYRVTIAFDGQRKSVLDDVGSSKTPGILRALENQIDDTADTKRWVNDLFTLKLVEPARP